VSPLRNGCLWVWKWVMLQASPWQITPEMPSAVVDLEVTRGAPERRNISYFSFSIMA